MRDRICLAALAAALLFCFAVPQAAAQLTSGTVSGSVRDAQAAVIGGASVSLISETRGTRLPPVTTSASGDFVFLNVPQDTYTLEITHTGFKTLKRPGLAVSPGDRVGLGVLALEVGAVTQTVEVTAAAPLLQTQSAERSFTVAPASVENLPISGRSFLTLVALTPGVTGITRIGDRASSGGGNTNVMLDGVSIMDTGNNGIMAVVNVEAIDEVKVLVSNYQAEYGRSSGLQITGVTKSGSNSFHGSAYMLYRNGNWNSPSKTSILNGDPKGVSTNKDLGYSIGGPIGRPGRGNKLFFFYSHEFAPAETGGTRIRYRFPTALERAGNFSQTLDNLGNPYPYIKDPLLTGTCSSSSQTACFKDGGVLGKIPTNRLYAPGLKILDLYPMPNLSPTPSVRYNFEDLSPKQTLMANQPVVRIDYNPLPKLRVTGKLTAWGQPNKIIQGNIPGLQDSRQYKSLTTLLLSTTIGYNINPTTFLEATVGRSQNELAGCTQGQGSTRPTFCTSGLPMSEKSSLKGAGLTALPFLFPDAGVINKDYYAFTALEAMKPPIWDGSRIAMVPSFSWGGRISDGPPNFPFPGWLNINRTWDVSIALSKVKGRHTLKTGFYNTHSYKAQQRGGWAGSIDFGNSTSNPLDSQFGYANAVLGVFSSFNQASRYVEGNYVYNNTEAFVQDNWKVTSRLTLDYGARFVHQQPQYDKLGQGVNFLPEKWTKAQAPLLYLAGCATTSPCTGSNRQAKDPRTGALLGPTSGVAIGTLVPDSGNTLNGLFLSGSGGIPKTTYNWPTLNVAPRFGAAYDVTGRQKLILRGGAGLMYDRPAGNSIYSQVENPPTLTNSSLRYSTLQTMGSSGLSIKAVPSLNVYQLESGLPSTWNWNAGAQVMLPHTTMLDFTYAGQHSYNLVDNPNINTIDLGAAFLPQNQDPTLTKADGTPSNGLPGGAALLSAQMSAFRGYGGITLYMPRAWWTSHTLTLAITRRFAKGLAYGFNDTILLQQRGSSGARLQHNADGTFSERSDQAQADELFNNYIPNRHLLKAHVIWNVPGLKGGEGFLRPLKWASRDWMLSAIWTASSAGAYTVGTSFQDGTGSVNLTGSSNFGARTRVTGNPGGGCNYSDIYRQFNTSAFAPPQVGSVGLESGQDYLRGCFGGTLDLSLARDIRLGEKRRVELRLDAFNAPNQARINGRNTGMQVMSLTDYTIVNSAFKADGTLDPARSLPKNAGFGVANGYQGARNLQLQVRFVF